MKSRTTSLFQLSVFSFLLFAAVGCDSLHNTQVAANYSGNTNGTDGSVTGQVTTDISSNAAAGVQGSYDIDTGDYSVGFIVTLKQAPSEFARQQFVRAGGIPSGDTIWAFPDLTSRDLTDPVALALKAAGNEPGGASVIKFAKPNLP